MKAPVSPAIVREFEDYCAPSAGGSAGQRVLPCRLLRPVPFDVEKRYPLVLYLHGAGERGSDNVAHLRYLPEWMTAPAYRAKYPCFLLAPQCPADAWRIEVDRTGTRRRMAQGMGHRLEAILATVDRLLSKEAIDPARQYLTGISMGGFACWDLATRLPERFAAVAPVCGGGDPVHAARLVKTPIWAFHGHRDDIVPPVYSREMIAAVEAAGGSPRYTEFKGVYHDSWTPAYRKSECLDWMFAQSKKSTGE